MTLIFSGNNFKYQLEATCKLFLPVEGFDFIFLDEASQNWEKPEGDYCFICRITGTKTSMLSVYVRMGSSSAMEKDRLSNETKDYDDRCEFILARLLFKCMVKLTGKSPEWGVLTGVRPVKLINKLRASGLSYPEISERLSGEYLLTDEKIRLGYETALNQDSVISAMPEKSYSLYVSIPFCPTRCSY